jgi:hypothetical protein
MKETIGSRITNDLKESRINLAVMTSFIPIAFFTYLFHESGHWIFGEFLGNDMTFGLNNSAPVSGFFIKDSDALWSSVGGPVFTIIQSLLFLTITWITRSIYAYSIAFFAVFSRFFSIVFGGIKLQDEAAIASRLGTSQYLIAGIVLAILFLVLWRCTRMMKLNLKSAGYFTVLGTFAILIVIGADQLITKYIE